MSFSWGLDPGILPVGSLLLGEEIPPLKMHRQRWSHCCHSNLCPFSHRIIAHARGGHKGRISYCNYVNLLGGITLRQGFQGDRTDFVIRDLGLRVPCIERELVGGGFREMEGNEDQPLG